MSNISNQTLFSHFTIDRIERHIAIFSQKIWKNREGLSVLRARSDDPIADIQEASTAAFEVIPEGTWYGETSWDPVWFKIDLSPQEDNNTSEQVYLLWKVQGESTIYVDDTPWCGLDTAHTYAPIPTGVSSLYIRCGSYQTGLWMRPGERRIPEPIDGHMTFYSAALALRETAYWQMYHDLMLIGETIRYSLDQYGYPAIEVGYHKPLNRIPPLIRRLLYETDKALDSYDAGRIEACQKTLQTIYTSFPSTSLNGELAVIGNSHLDLVWLWPESVTHEKNIHTITTVLKLMEQYKEMRFTMSQPWLLDAIHQDYPQIYKEIKLQVDEGRWELTGGMYVEADTLLPCGESLIRCFTLGQSFFLQETGKISEVLWLPDAFGYSQCIPQIAQAAGIKYFYTTKLAWSAVNQFPYTSFIWEGLDGSSLISYISQVGYESRGTIEEVMRSNLTNKQAGISDEALFAIGFGDGGGGPTDEQCERIDRLKNFSSLPVCTWSRADEFFHRLGTRAELLPHYRGELYLEYHRGTYTTMQLMKERYRQVERALQTLEAAAAATHSQLTIEHLWKRLVFMQFHDALPGSSIRLVYDQLVQELDRIQQEAAARTVSLLSNEPARYSIFNTHAVSGDWVCIIPKELLHERKEATDSDNRLPSQLLSNGDIAIQISLEGLEGKEFSITEDTDTITYLPSLRDDRHLENERVSVVFSQKGMIEKVTIDGEPLLINRPTALYLHPDIPAHFDAWEIDHSAIENKHITADDLGLAREDQGPLVTSLTGKAAVGEASSALITYSIINDSPYVFVKMTIDWQEEHTLLRYEIPTDYVGTDGRFGTPFGSIDRPATHGPLTHEAQWEQPASRWCAVTDGMHQGLAVITESTYGFSIKDGIINISLLRSPCSSDEQSIRHKEVFADKGVHSIEFAIGRYYHQTTDRHHSTAQAADTLYTRPLFYNGRSIPPPFSWESIGSLTISWVSPLQGEDGYLIRMHETAGQSGTALVCIHENKNRKVFLEDLLGNRIDEIKIFKDHVSIPYHAYQLITLTVRDT